MNSMLIVTFVTLTWSVNYGYSADIVDPGNIFDRYNPLRSIVGAQPYDNAKLNAFTLPGRMIQSMSNVALAPWRGNDFSGRGGKMPRMGNLFRGLPFIGSAFGGRGGSGGFGGNSNNNYGPMAPVEMARAPGSGSASASASASASSSVNTPNQPNRSVTSGPFTGYPSLPPSSTNGNWSPRPSSSPTTVSISSPSAGLPSIPTVGTSTMGGAPTSTGTTSTSRLPSANLMGSPSPSGSVSASISSPTPGSGSALASANSASSSSSSSSGIPAGLSSLLSAAATPAGLGQASNFLSNLFSYPLNG